jgi:hypothetical protein
MAKRMMKMAVTPKAANGMRGGPANGHSTKGAVKKKDQSPPPKPTSKNASRKFSL